MPDDDAGPVRPPALLRSIAHRLAGDDAPLPVEGHLPGFDGATGWLNSEPLTPAALRGRVVAVDFWTYTCINWLRAAPYVKAWAAKYRDHGLTVIGVHAPEFGFERNVDNVTTRSAGFGVDYPVAIDSDYGVWQAFANHYWPALYVADAEGRIRWHHFGEGEYEMSEMVIQQLLLEAGNGGFDPALVDVDPQGLEVAADFRTLRSPETYLGSRQTTGFALDPARLGLNEWAPTGPWTLAEHAAVSAGPGARIAFRFQARDVNLVMGPATAGAAVPYRVTLDGQAPGDAHGFDIDAQGAGTLVDQRLHQLIRQPGAVSERTVEIEFCAADAEAYCFTFG